MLELNSRKSNRIGATNPLWSSYEYGAQHTANEVGDALPPARTIEGTTPHVIGCQR